MYYLSPISPDQVTAGIWSLFDPSKPTMPRAFNVLEGVNRGQILVDDPVYPTLAVVREAMYGTFYFGGAVNISLMNVLVDEFRRLGDVGIGCWPDDPINEMIPYAPEYDGKTLYFTQRSRVGDENESPLPDGYALVMRDLQLLRQSPDYQSTLDAFGTEENILQHTLGVMVLYGGNVVCEAATGAPTHGRIEVGVTTDPSHRQRGLASIACRRLIRMCEERGLETWWDCAKQNTPSVRLANKLGYQNGREYRYMLWTHKHETES